MYTRPKDEHSFCNVDLQKMQLDIEVSPPANDLQMGNLQIPKVIKYLQWPHR